MHLQPSLTPRLPSVPTVRVCEPRAGAAGDPQLRPGGVGGHQVSDWPLELGPGSSAARGGSPGGGGEGSPQELSPAPRFILRFPLLSRTRIAELPPPAAPGRSCAPTPRSRDPERRGRRGGRGWEGGSRGRRERSLWVSAASGSARAWERAARAGRSQAPQAPRLPRGQGPRGPQRPPPRSSSQRP